MEISDIKLHPDHQPVLLQFVHACQADERILAAFLGGSYARGAADEFSDLDLYLIISDGSYDDFIVGRSEFVRLLGDPLFIEDFDFPETVFFFFANGCEGELGIGRESNFADIHSGPYHILVDKKQILAGVEFTLQTPDPAGQVEKVRRLIYWFWHDLSHFITAMERDQLWWAQGQLEELRRYCVNLARMKNNFSDPEIGNEPYFKIEKIIPVEQLSSLRDTFPLLEKGALLDSGIRIVRVYQELARSLTQDHEVTYPEALERLMLQRLEDLQESTTI
jgi:predicted nucleotidyltransferase